MSMEDNMIRIVRVGNEWWIGTLEPAAALRVSGRKLMSPRVMGKTQEPPQKWVCLEMLGKPATAELPTELVLLDVTDKDIITAYREAVTGLLLAKTMPKNVVNLGDPNGGRM